MPPPPIPIVKRPSAAPQIGVEEPVEADQTTPKASATRLNDAVPAFSLSDLEPTPSVTSKPPSAPANGLMGPPPPRLPTLAPMRNSGPAARNAPIPNRGPAGGSSSLLPPPSASSLAPPPTHNTKPKKPSKQVTLTPGHSPLDWARLSSSPTSDLRGLPPASPYLRVTPSMLRRQTGRRGKDAWSALGGRVYNITPYLPFHPGGEPELLRGAGRDGTRLFGEIHPWVNYETMLSACLVGILVDEDEKESKMEEMD
ncbi:putative cytochrome b5-like heme steroid binding domain-containing protein [Phaeoacremonium minimum UCRPA7]|uniref:Putative cytochrome b5-like heme steroid binding domain-containing protein n=1 Tax=Phaeoacremonium minimum (strain UCR-PA7) TaxID=1286976 RepID=R8BSM9_PHAM7|nr:putative cytochrome b5-like heme steroid binding domain-containing protein [Phaeoacremonium minimum UCRPA7]EOO02388.1 putative cytochrome b5-like heme steroid binding domain-containing protein [Phaeoacremonium minimum UCRPA7]